MGRGRVDQAVDTMRGRGRRYQAVDTMRPEGVGAGERETKLIIKNNTLNKIQLMCLISMKLSKCQIVD